MVIKQLVTHFWCQFERGTVRSMNHVLIDEFKLRQRKLSTPKYLKLEQVENHRRRVIQSAKQISQILKDGNEIIGVDCEMFEFDQSKTTEIGIGIISKHDTKVEHLVIDDYYQLRNKKRVPDNKDNFIYGISERVSLDKATERVINIFKNSKYIFGHAIKGDLSQLNVKFPGQVRFDTSTLHTNLCVAQEGIFTTRKKRLSHLCEIYTPKLSETPYHNAGNDIYVTGEILKRLGDVNYIKGLMSKLTDQEILERTRQDEVLRIVNAIPQLNRDLTNLLVSNQLDFPELMSNPDIINYILSVQQNIYRRMLNHGAKEFWESKVELGMVGELFTLATPINTR
jgi:hypothetical protein